MLLRIFTSLRLKMNVSFISLTFRKLNKLSQAKFYRCKGKGTYWLPLHGIFFPDRFGTVWYRGCTGWWRVENWRYLRPGQGCIPPSLISQASALAFPLYGKHYRALIPSPAPGASCHLLMGAGSYGWDTWGSVFGSSETIWGGGAFSRTMMVTCETELNTVDAYEPCQLESVCVFWRISPGLIWIGAFLEMEFFTLCLNCSIGTVQFIIDSCLRGMSTLCLLQPPCCGYAQCMDIGRWGWGIIPLYEQTKVGIL